MSRCTKCEGKGYINFKSSYMGIDIHDYKPCFCLKQFLAKATPKEVLEYCRNGLKNTNKAVFVDEYFNNNDDGKTYTQMDIEGKECCPF